MKRKMLGITLAFTSLLVGCGQKDVKIDTTKEKFLVGIVQFVQHEALDCATEGFKTALTEELGKRGRQVEFDFRNGSKQVELCTQAVDSFKAKGVDLIMANATPAVQAAFAATEEIPILGTSVTDYGAATGLEMKDGKSGTNISGTSDLAKIEDQIDVMLDLLQKAGKPTNKIGILYCSTEANSKFQVDKATAYLQSKGITVNKHSFTESTDLSVACNACLTDDAVYIPTDNTVAEEAEAVKTSVADHNIPIFAGESGICKVCGFATLSIDYTNLGKITGRMAAEILTGEKKIETYEIQYTPKEEIQKMYNPEICTALGINVGEDFVAC